MTTTCPRHNNVMQFLEVSKNCQVTWLKSSTFWKKSYFKFALNVFFMKKLKSAILSQNHRRSQGGGPGVKKSYFNPIFTNIFNKRFFQNKHFFFKNFPKQFFHFPKQFFSTANIFSKFYKNRPAAAGGSAPRPPSVTRLSTLAFSTRLLS